MKRFLIVLLISLLSGCSNLSGDNQYASSEQASDPNFKDGIYVNNHIEHPEKSFFSFVKMRFFGDDVWHDPESQKHLIPKTEADLNTIKNSELSQVTWLGHSTFLIQHQGMNLLTDPIFSVRASPFSFAGPKRYTPVATKLSELPPIDVVVISHNHYDHLDEASIKALGNDPVYFIPSNLTPWFLKAGIEPDRVVALRWWQQAPISSTKAMITATPSQHWSSRSLTDRNETHWASWLIELDGLTMWFGGDTGYNNRDFVKIGEHIVSAGKNWISL